MAKVYPAFKKSLQGLNGLSDKEAEAFFKLCGKKHFCVKDVRQIMLDIKAYKKNSKSSAYNVVEKLEKEGLITSVSNSNKKQEYVCVHPRAVYNKLKINLEEMKKELPELETAYDTSDFEVEDPRNSLKILKSESEIYSECYSLQKNYQITIIHDDTKNMAQFVEGIKECGKVISGNTNLILFKSKDKETSGVIEILKRTEKEPNIRLYGFIFFDNDKYKYYLKKEVKK